MQANAQDRSRPLFHFTPEHGWMNDPNGLVFFRGEWHLFYQYYEPRQVDGLQWGHAVSRDLVHWQHLPPAIPPDANGHIWSGSAVVDGHDSSGFFGGKPGIVCLFTYWNPADGRQCQGLAFSPDGRQFTTYGENPVIPQLRHLPDQPDDKDFRDPKVFWHEPTRRWVMAVAGGKLRFFTSTNLREWTFESVTDDLHTECPDLFPLPIDGDALRLCWVLSGGGRWYRLGQFDGRRFHSETPPLPMTHGPDFYASQTWDSAPEGRRVMISWLFSWRYGCRPDKGAIVNRFPDAPWAGGCLTVPYELSLRTTPAGPRLVQQPVREVERLRSAPVRLAETVLRPGSPNPLRGLAGDAFDLRLRLAPEPNTTVALRIPAAAGGFYLLAYESHNARLVLDRSRSGFDNIPDYTGRYEAPLALAPDGTLSLRILLDRSAIEVFGDDGLVTLQGYIPREASMGELTLGVDSGACRVADSVAHPMGA